LLQGANVNARDAHWETPLHYAAYWGKTEVAASLIQKGAKVNARDVYDETPLHHAAYWGKTQVAALLIAKGAKVNARDVNQKTPLHYAAEDQPEPNQPCLTIYPPTSALRSLPSVALSSGWVK
jgi:ankyrin repeat protein